MTVNGGVRVPKSTFLFLGFPNAYPPQLARVRGIEPPARGFGDLSAPCAHPYIGTGVRDRTSIT